VAVSLAASQFDPDWTVVCVSTALCATVLGSVRLTKGSLFSPWRMFLLANLGGLAIAHLRLHKLMTPWALETWIVWSSAVAAFSAGAWVSHLVGFGPPSRAGAWREPQHRLERLVFLLISLPYLFSVAGGVLAVGTFPVFASDPERARTLFAFHAPWSAWFLSSCLLIFPFGARVLARGGKGVLWHHVLFWSIFAMQMLSGIRGPALFGLFCLASQWELMRKGIPLLKVVVGVGLFLALFIGVALLRLGDAVHLAKGIPTETLVSLVVGPPYIYVANCYWNLDHGIREILAGVGHPSTWGFSVTQGMWDILGVGDGIAKSLGFDSIFNETSAKRMDLNTFSFVWTLYKDGGIPFAVLFSAAWGFVTELLHRMAAKGDDSVGILSTYLGFAALFSFFSLYFVVGGYMVFLVLAILLISGIRRASAAPGADSAEPA